MPDEKLPPAPMGEPSTPSPGVYVVGEFRGLRKIAARDGSTHYFAQVLTDVAMLEMYVNVDLAVEYGQKAIGDPIIIPAEANLRKDKKTGASLAEIGWSVRREVK